MQLMGNILWLIMEGFGSCLGEHPLLFGDFKLVKQDEFFADHHRANFRERESVLNTKSGFVFLGFIYTRMRCSLMVLRHLEFEC